MNYYQEIVEDTSSVVEQAFDNLENLKERIEELTSEAHLVGIEGINKKIVQSNTEKLTATIIHLYNAKINCETIDLTELEKAPSDMTLSLGQLKYEDHLIDDWAEQITDKVCPETVDRLIDKLRNRVHEFLKFKLVNIEAPEIQN